MGHAPENYHNLKEIFDFPSIRKIFSLDSHVRISCDFKVAALLVGIQQASSKYPCPFCLWGNDTICTGVPDLSRKREEIMVDLENKRHNVINEPIIHWSESVMEKVALAPLRILLGLVNKLFSEAKPNHKPSNRNGRQLYKLLCLTLCKYITGLYFYYNCPISTRDPLSPGI